MAIFASPLNNVASTLALNYTAGSGTMSLVEGYGATINARLAQLGLPSISATSPLRYSIFSASMIGPFGWFPPTYLPSIYQATGLSGDDLTGVTIQEGTTDQNFQSGDIFWVVLTAGQIADIEAAINALSTAPDGVLKGENGSIVAAVPDVDFVTPWGPSSTITFPADGSIVQVDSNGLTETTTFPADGSIVDVFSGAASKIVTTVSNADGSLSVVVS